MTFDNITPEMGEHNEFNNSSTPNIEDSLDSMASLYENQELNTGITPRLKATLDSEEDLGLSVSDFDLSVGDLESITGTVDPALEDSLSLDFEGLLDLEDDTDMLPPQPFDQVLASVDVNIKYKQAEVDAYRSKQEMQVTPAMNKLYNTLNQGTTSMDRTALHALMRSVINADNQSVFSNKNTYLLVIFRILDSIIVRFSESRTDLAPLYEKYHAALENFERVETSMAGLVPVEGETEEDAHKRAEQIVALKAIRSKCILDIQTLIAEDITIDHMYNAICTAIPKIETLKKFLVVEERQESQYSREVNAHLDNLEYQLNVLMQAKEALLSDDEPQFIDTDEGEEEIQVPKATIFRKVMLPAFEDNVRGFRYMCGNCGKIHFTKQIPVFVNRLPQFKPVTFKDGSFNETFNAITSQAVEFEPVICESCKNVNLFDVSFIRMLKYWIITQMNEGQYRTTTDSAIPSTSEINFSNEYIERLLETQHCTSLLTAERAVSVTEDTNPLDTEEFDTYLQDFIQFVGTNRVTSRLAQDTYQRNLRYLNLLYTSRSASISNVDDVSAAITILETKPDAMHTLMQVADNLIKINKALFLRTVSERLSSVMGEIIYKDILVTPDTLERVNAQLAKLGCDDSDTVESLTALRTQYRELAANFAKTYADTVTIPIRRIDKSRYRNLINSGVLTAAWPVLQPRYMDMLTMNAAVMASKNLISPIVFGARAYKKSQTYDALTEINKTARAICKERRIELALPSVDLETAADPTYAPLAIEGVVMGTSGHAVAIATYELLRGILTIDNASSFEAATRVPARVLSMSMVATNIPSYQDIEDNLVTSMASCMGEEYNYQYMLGRSSLENIISTLTQEERLAGNLEASDDETAIGVYKTAYLFATCVPTNNTEFKHSQSLTLETLKQMNNLVDSELQRLEEL